MNNDIDNFKELIDSALKDIKVTDELKSLTIKRCLEEKKRNNKPIFVTAASAAIIAFSIFSYNLILNKADFKKSSGSEALNKSVTLNDATNSQTPKIETKENENTKINNITNNTPVSKNSETQNKSINSTESVQNKKEPATAATNNTNTIASDSNKTSPIGKSEAPKVSSDIQDSKLKNIPIESFSESTKNTKTDDLSDSSALAAETPSMKLALVEQPMSISIADAENFWGGKLLTPSYTPKDFELTDISLSKDKSKEIWVKLNYSNQSSYFKIIQNKSTTYTTYAGTSIDINGSKAYISKIKDATDPNLTLTEINWVNNNIQYTINGNLQEGEMIKILNSLTAK